MIDFKLDHLGDLSFAENAKEYPKFRIDFGVSEGFSRLRIDFHTKSVPLKNNGLKINFVVSEDEIKHGKTFVPCVRNDNEKAQSIAIRLKTELDELAQYYGSFGSELVRIRHEDLKNTGNHEIVKSYVAEAISDIIPSDGMEISVKRKTTEKGKLQAATLGIEITEKPGKKLFEYEI